MNNQLDTITAEALQKMRDRQAQWEKRHEIQKTPEQIEKEVEYWNRVYSTEAKRNTAPSARAMTPEKITYDEARKKIGRLLQERADEITRIEGREFRWQFDENEKRILQNMTRYFINDPACEWSLTKGLFLYGVPGTGKTEIMRIFCRFAAENDLKKKFEFSSLSEIHAKAKADKENDPISSNVQFDRVFDEFGRNTGPVIRFGDPLDINETLIEQRYERSRRYGQITHLIANGTPNDMQELFSPMIFDRIRQMCTSVHFQGESKRK
jgi:DNA replication protein DnaC